MESFHKKKPYKLLERPEHRWQYNNNKRINDSRYLYAGENPVLSAKPLQHQYKHMFKKHFAAVQLHQVLNSSRP
jgi:hypothetical protein